MELRNLKFVLFLLPVMAHATTYVQGLPTMTQFPTPYVGQQFYVQTVTPTPNIQTNNWVYTSQGFQNFAIIQSPTNTPIVTETSSPTLTFTPTITPTPNIMAFAASLTTPLTPVLFACTPCSTTSKFVGSAQGVVATATPPTVSFKPVSGGVSITLGGTAALTISVLEAP